jgi:hypothetical protein
MIISLALVLLCTFSGAVATYLYDEGASVPSRLCTGVCAGLAILGLVGFCFASFLGLTPTAILLTMLVVLAIPGFVMTRPDLRSKIRQQSDATSQSIRRALLRPSTIPLATLLYVVVAVVLWRVFDRAVIEEPTGLSTGVLNNFGDLPFHISVITSFVFGNNFPPQDPTFAGVKFTYPFITDFVSAIFVRCGADLRQSMFIENFAVAFALVGLIHRCAGVLLRDRLAAILTPLLVLLNGGFGWILLWQKATSNENGLMGLLSDLPPSFTIIPETTWRWGNAISTLLIPQRGILLGLGLAVMVFTQWWLAGEPADESATEGESNKRAKKSKQKKAKHAEPQIVRGVPLYRMIAAGVVAGLVPLVHAHTFVVIMTMGACIALLQIILLKGNWRDWLVFFAVASVIALPQMWWSTHGSAVDAKEFFEWQFGWDRGKAHPVWFWFINTGLFIPLIVIAILWRGKEYLVSRRLLFFYLPFLLCFIVPNVMKMAPWVWDNIKVLYYWWLASAPLVALSLARLWRRGAWQSGLALILFVFLVAAGSLDVAAIALRSVKYQVFDRNGIDFAEQIKQTTEPQALIIHAPVHNTPVFLTGRRSLMGYPGHIWTHGLKFVERENEIKRIYTGAPDALGLLQKYGVKYAVISPHERRLMPVNEQFFSRFPKVSEVGEYSLYKITTP